MQDRPDFKPDMVSSQIHSFDSLIHEIYAIPGCTTSGGIRESSKDARILSLAVEDLQKRSGIKSHQTCEGLFMHGAIRFAHQIPAVVKRAPL